MSEAGKSVSPSARTKKLMLNSQLKALQKMSQEADQLIGTSTPTDDDQCVAELTTVREFLALFTETVTKTETLFGELADMVYDFTATKTAEKEIKRKEEENLETVVQEITENNGKLAKLKGRQAVLATKPSVMTAAAATGVNTTNVQIDTSALERTIAKLAHEKSGSANSVRLPKLETKPFNGDILNFTEFWDLFVATVHNNAQLSNVEKLSYLKNQVVGSAAEAIAGITLTNSNYPVACDILKERFGKEHAISHALFAALVEIPPARNTAQSLRALYNEVETNVRSLEAAGKSVQQELMVPLITSKLPRTALMQLELSKTSPWTVDSLRKALGHYTDAKEAADRLSGETPKSDDQKSRGKDERQSRAFTASHSQPAQSLVANSQAPKPEKPRRCWYCRENHFTDECKKFPTLAARREKIGSRCYVCLREGHSATQCPDPWQCFHCKSKSHHRSICPDKFPTSSHRGTTMVVSNAPSSIPTHTLVCNNEQGVLQIAPACLSNDNGENDVNAHVLFDTGSSRTFITEELRKKLNAKPIGYDEVAMAGFGDNQRQTHTYPRVVLQVKLPNGTSKEIVANVTNHITCPIERVPLDSNEYPALEEVQLADPICNVLSPMSIEVLVGVDYYHQFIHPERIQVSGDLFLVKSEFGYIPTGKIGNGNGNNVLFVSTGETNDPEFDLRRFWEIEQIGITDQSDISDDESAMQHFNTHLGNDEGRYTVNWPWKDDSMEPSDTYQLALGRLRSLLKRMAKTPDLVAKYDEVIRDQLNKGIIEAVEDVNHSDGKVHYLPHHAVFKEDSSTTKVRVVFDASAKTNVGNNSLNDCLHTGPSLTPDLAGVLLRFRLNPVGIIADVEKAFLQLSLEKSDRDVTRFFWLKNVNGPVNAENLIVYRFCRVPFGVVSSPFLLSATVQHHLAKTATTTAGDLQTNIYVDNVLTGTSTSPEAVIFYKEAKEVFNRASMNLRSWASNSTEFLESIPATDRDGAKVQKCLGLQWDTSDDTVSVNPVDVNQVTNTKRGILKWISRFYDPLGYHSPIVVKAKCLLQDIWREEHKWDETLPDRFLKQWQEVAGELQLATQVKIPRSMAHASDEATTHELHVFSDASQKAYAAVAYLRQVSEDGISSHLLMSKTRVAPLKEQTIPRLELMATLIGVRMVSFLRQQIKLQLTRVCVWTDSTCVLGWINAPEKKQPVFVENRLKEIRSEPNVEFRHIESKENPADHPSRGSAISTSLDSAMWWHGPAVLQQKQLPTEPCISVLLHGEGPTEESAPSTPFGMDPTRYTSFLKVLRVTAYVTRFIALVSKKPSTTTSLTTKELSDAETRWLSYAQHADYGDVFRALKHGNRTDLIGKLGLIADENGILRCKGRMENASLPPETKCPALLCGKNQLSRLIIADAHRRLIHGGTSATLMTVRKKYWITKGRETVKRQLKRCQHCKRHTGGPFRMPEMPPFPKGKVTGGRAPFSTCGVDYFGPLMVKGNDGPTKAWVILFTCFTTRAVHLELVLDMTTNTFLMAFRRFISRRGTPSRMISDNGKQFKLASSTIDSIWKTIDKCDDVLNYVTTVGTKWSFITELAPWQGGFYERMVQVVKRCLRKSVGRSILCVYNMETLLIECEAVVNGRPLTYISDDLDQPVITPSHFLSLNANIGFPGVTPQEQDDPNFRLNPSSAEVLIEQLRLGQRQLERFWKVWSEEYLSALRERGDYKIRQGKVKSTETPSVGSIVLVKEQYAPRAAWSLGRVTELHTSSDAEVRSATVRLPNGKVLNRALNFLFPMECPTIQNTEPQPAAACEPPEPVETRSRKNPNESTPRPVRRTSQASREKLQEHIQAGNV